MSAVALPPPRQPVVGEVLITSRKCLGKTGFFCLGGERALPESETVLERIEDGKRSVFYEALLRSEGNRNFLVFSDGECMLVADLPENQQWRVVLPLPLPSAVPMQLHPGH